MREIAQRHEADEAVAEHDRQRTDAFAQHEFQGCIRVRIRSQRRRSRHGELERGVTAQRNLQFSLPFLALCGEQQEPTDKREPEAGSEALEPHADDAVRNH